MSLGSTLKRNKSTPGSNKRPPIEKGRWASKGTKPLPDQASVQHILSVMVIHICRKVLFIATEVKITLYSIGLFFGSIICDFLPIPKLYMASKDNIFNQYFVKFSWGWAAILVGSFIYLTSVTYGCGHKEIVKRNMSRIVIGTLIWLFWTKVFFQYIERSTGVCLGKAIIKDRLGCTQGGFQWHSFDISGHAFILVYINLVLVEEAKAILGWEGIRDLLRLEEHTRNGSPNLSPSADEKTALSGLSQPDLDTLKDNYETWTPYIRFLFLCMTIMSLSCDVMLACTIVYYHTMPQKVVGGIIAMATWYFTYNFWFTKGSYPGLPGKGLFSYQHLTTAERAKETTLKRRTSSLNKETKEVTTFMGMPLYANARDRERKREPDDRDDEKSTTDENEINSRYLPKGDYFSSASKNRKYRSSL